MSRTKRLNPKQSHFVECYLGPASRNAAEAARMAGYTGKNAGVKLMANRLGSRAISAGDVRVCKEFRIDGERVLRQLMCALTINPIVFFRLNKNGIAGLKDPRKVPAAAMRCVSKFKFRTRHFKDGSCESTGEIELMSKDQMMALAMRHLGLLTPAENDDPEMKQRLDMASVITLLQEARQRPSNILDLNAMKQRCSPTSVLMIEPLWHTDARLRFRPRAGCSDPNARSGSRRRRQSSRLRTRVGQSPTRCSRR